MNPLQELLNEARMYTSSEQIDNVLNCIDDRVLTKTLIPESHNMGTCICTSRCKNSYLDLSMECTISKSIYDNYGNITGDVTIPKPGFMNIYECTNDISGGVDNCNSVDISPSKLSTIGNSKGIGSNDICNYLYLSLECMGVDDKKLNELSKSESIPNVFSSSEHLNISKDSLNDIPERINFISSIGKDVEDVTGKSTKSVDEDGITTTKLRVHDKDNSFNYNEIATKFTELGSDADYVLINEPEITEDVINSKIDLVNGSGNDLSESIQAIKSNVSIDRDSLEALVDNNYVSANMGVTYSTIQMLYKQLSEVDFRYTDLNSIDLPPYIDREALSNISIYENLYMDSDGNNVFGVKVEVPETIIIKECLPSYMSIDEVLQAISQLNNSNMYSNYTPVCNECVEVSIPSNSNSEYGNITNLGSINDIVLTPLPIDDRESIHISDILNKSVAIFGADEDSIKDITESSNEHFNSQDNLVGSIAKRDSSKLSETLSQFYSNDLGTVIGTGSVDSDIWESLKVDSDSLEGMAEPINDYNIFNESGEFNKSEFERMMSDKAYALKQLITESSTNWVNVVFNNSMKSVPIKFIDGIDSYMSIGAGLIDRVLNDSAQTISNAINNTGNVLGALVDPTSRPLFDIEQDTLYPLATLYKRWAIYQHRFKSKLPIILERYHIYDNISSETYEIPTFYISSRYESINNKYDNDSKKGLSSKLNKPKNKDYRLLNIVDLGNSNIIYNTKDAIDKESELTTNISTTDSEYKSVSFRGVNTVRDIKGIDFGTEFYWDIILEVPSYNQKYLPPLPFSIRNDGNNNYGDIRGKSYKYNKYKGYIPIISFSIDGSRTMTESVDTLLGQVNVIGGCTLPSSISLQLYEDAYYELDLWQREYLSCIFQIGGSPKSNNGKGVEALRGDDRSILVLPYKYQCMYIHIKLYTMEWNEYRSMTFIVIPEFDLRISGSPTKDIKMVALSFNIVGIGIDDEDDNDSAYYKYLYNLR